MENEEIKESIIEEEKNLLEEYKKLKENSVSKEQYQHDIEELKEKNQLYLKAITEGGKVTSTDEPDIPLDERIQKLSRFKGTNLEYWDETTKAIDQIFKTMREEEINAITGQDGLDELLEVRDVMKKMVEDANGDPDYFIKLYKARVKDSAPKISADIEKAGGLVNYLQSKN